MDATKQSSRSGNMPGWPLVLVAAFAAFGIAVGCGGEDVGGTASGVINVVPQPVNFERTPIGETAEQTVTIRNTTTGTGELTVFSVKLEALEGESIANLSLSGAPSETIIKPGGSLEFTVSYSPTEDSDTQGGEIVVESSDPSKPTERVAVNTIGNAPDLRVSPPSLSFPQLPAGQSARRNFTISNDGSAPLRIFEKPIIQGSGDFTVNLPNVSSYPVELFPVGASEEGQRSRIEGSVSYAATDGGSSTATMIIRSDESQDATQENPAETEVPIAADADTACIRTSGTTRNMGAAPVGGEISEVVTVENCGTRSLEIDAVRWSANSPDQEFSYDLGGADENDDGTLDEPVVLPEQGDEYRITVRYSPTEIGEDEATLAIESNDPFQPTLNINLIARGADGECPTADIVPQIEGETTPPRPTITAAPLDYVILDGTASEDPDGRVVEYEWRNIQSPEDTTIQREDVDGASPPNSKQRFRLLTAGTYKVGLKVRDNDGFVSCNEAVQTIQVVPDERIHVELTWTNPEDPDETDKTGSDVDLHLLKMGPGEWFEAPYDIYFDNPNNGSDPTGGGGGIWNPESPSLDIDDTDGAGPENIQMDNPQDCQWYAVGVHYYEQKFGTAYATIRIYINEELAFVQKHKPLTLGGQFWDVARIHWDSGRVYAVDTLHPSPPTGEKPPVTTEMENSGLCTSQNLYTVSNSSN